jgi:mono/diheme cytochrome c family protein
MVMDAFAFKRYRAAIAFLFGLNTAGFVTAACGADGPGKQAFERVCAECHGPSGEGADAPPLVPVPHGVQEILGIARTGKGNMPPLPRSAITDDEIRAVVAYLQTLGEGAK